MKNPNEIIGRFMIGVGAVILHPTEDKVLLIRRATELNTGSWEFVYGRVNQGEELLDAVHREVEEETGLKVKITKLLRLWHIYRGEKKAEHEVFGMTFICRANTDEVIISDEHSEFQWVPLKGVSKLISIPGIKKDITLYLAKKQKSQAIFTDLSESITLV